jgi:putative aminopeptidase FrvX
MNRITTRGIFFLLALIVAAQTASVFGQPAEVKVSTEEELKEDVLKGPCKNDDRHEAVKALFKRLGVADEDIKVEKFKDIQNIVITRKGKTAETVVVGAHYDKVKDGCGIIDNWSGIVILAHIYRTFSTMEPQKSYMFVAFDREEEGLKGSSAMAKAIPKEDRPKYCSMVNFDSFGLGYPLILENASSPKMTKMAKDLGTELKAPVNSISLAGSADADSSSFKDKDIPAITISALNNKWAEYLHSSKDKAENVNFGSIRVGYLYGLQYLAKVDGAGCAAFR